MRKPITNMTDVHCPFGVKQFNEKVPEWEKKMECIIIEITGATNDNGVPLLVDAKPLINEFNKLMKAALSAVESDGVSLRIKGE